jgi:subtilisin family serine protease
MVTPVWFARRQHCQFRAARLWAERLEDRLVWNATAPEGLSAGGPQATFPQDYDPSTILVRFAGDAAKLTSTAAPAGTEIGSPLPLVPGLRSIQLAPGMDVATALAAYRALPGVVYAEPNYELHAQETPNDPQFTSQWGLNNVGQTGGTPDADIDAPEAWDYTTGNSATVVAVIDTGVDYTHPDLQANIWTNPGEIPGNGIDDDGNGFVDDVHGYDFANHDGNPMDDNNHGTHVAGIIGAVGNNGVGVTGINWNVKIMAVKFLDANGSGTTSDAILALNYAVANGAVISNNSYGGDPFNQSLFDAIQNARNAGHIYVAAAGNGNFLGIGQDNDSTPFYPANYNLDNVVSVAATDSNDNLASFSNYGRTTVDLAAPGVSILSTTRNNTYMSLSGTSMATPHVTGVLALVRGEHPDWSYSQVISQVLSTTDPIPALQGKTVTGGRLNAWRAVQPPPVIDLNWAGGGISGPATTAVDAPFTLSRTYTISGEAAARDFTIAYYASRDTTLGNGDDILLGTETISASTDGALGKHSGASPAFQFTSGGPYYLFARVDAGDAILEVNENNNVTQAPQPVAVAGPQIIDDGDFGFATAGTWITHAETAYQGDIHYSAAGSGADTATWTFTVTPGRYRVSATWSPYSNRATDSPFTVLDGATPLATVRVNQEAAPADFAANGATWADLGGPYDVLGNTLVVRLTDQANEYVIADAVRVERVGDAVGPEMLVLDGATPIVDGSLNTVNFGTTGSGVPVSRTFTVRNVGSANLVLSNPISVPAGFQVTSGFGATVLPRGAATTFTVQLTAAAVGTYTGSISFGNNDADENPFDIPVAGVVTAQIVDDGDAGFATTGAWTAHAETAYQGDIHYSAAGTGANAATWTFNVTPGRYRVSATWSPYSNRATDSPFTVLDGATPLATVRVNQEPAPNGFTDAGVGWQDLGGPYEITGNMLVVRLTNLANEYVIADAIRVERVGELAGPEILVLDGGTSITDGGATPVGFGNTQPSVPVSRTFTVRNVGSADLVLSNPISVPAGFTLTAGFGATVLPRGAATTFTVQMDAAAIGTYTGSVSFGNNDADEGPFNFVVSGVVAPVIIDDGDAGFTTTGSWITHAETAYQGDIHYSAAGTGADTASWTFSVTPGRYRVSATWSPYSNRATDSPFTVLDGATPLATVRVSQEAAPADFAANGATWADLGGQYDILGNTLVVRLTDQANQYVIADAVRVERVGDAVGPEIQVLDGSVNVVDGAPFNFGSTPFGTPLSHTFTVRNVGTADLVLSGPITVPAGFQVTSGFGATVLPRGAVTTFTVQMTANVSGTYAGSISFGNNDADEGPFNIPAQGVVTAQIIDDGDAGFATTGTWITHAETAYQGDIHYSAAGTGANAATWTFNVTPGRYRVSATWSPYSNRATDSPFTVLDGATPLATVRVNQEAAPADFTDAGAGWQDLGGPYEITGNALVVRLTNQANEYVIADAIRVERLGDLTGGLSVLSVGAGGPESGTKRSGRLIGAIVPASHFMPSSRPAAAASLNLALSPEFGGPPFLMPPFLSRWLAPFDGDFTYGAWLSTPRRTGRFG